MSKISIKRIYRSTRDLSNKTILFMEDLIHNPIRKRNTEKPVKYIHIGYPKAASTALQRGFFGRHNQLYHLGAGTKNDGKFWDDHGYIDKEINIAMEIDFRYRNNLSYNGRKVKKYFNKHFQNAEENKNIHAVGISNENFCFNWHGGIDITEKVKRLRDVFDNKTKILIILRNQKKLIESLYKENIRFGYSGNFNEYLKYLWTYKDRNYLYEFCFDKVVTLYSEYFEKENIHLFFFEDLKKDNSKFLKDISNAIEIDYYNLSFSKEYNKQLDSKELNIKRMLNEKYPHTFGKGIYREIDTHRFIPYFTDELNDQIDDDVFIDYQTRNQFNVLSSLIKSKINTPKLNLSWENKYGELILQLFSESNKVFSNVRKEIKEKLDIYQYTKLK